MLLSNKEKLLFFNQLSSVMTSTAKVITNNSSNTNNANSKCNKFTKLSSIIKSSSLPERNVKLLWLKNYIPMRIVMFYGSKSHNFSQFSNLYHCKFHLDTGAILRSSPTDVQSSNRTFWNTPNTDTSLTATIAKKVSSVIMFDSSENAFQSSKAKLNRDCLFVHGLSPGNSARAGQGRLIMEKGLAQKYIAMGGKPLEIANNRWVMNADKHNEKRYERRCDWRQIKIEVMFNALRMKFDQNPDLIAEYVSSEIPILFVEHTKNDSRWADANDGTGTNFLGKLLTLLCWEYRELAVNPKSDFNVDIVSSQFKKWLELPNVELIEDGKAFYNQFQ